MCKTFFTLISLLFCLPCFAQMGNLNPTLKKYAGDQQDTNFYLVCAKPRLNEKFIKEIKRKAVRELPGKAFIISKSSISGLDREEVDVITPANNLWKLSSEAEKILKLNYKSSVQFLLSFGDEASFESFLQMNIIGNEKMNVFDSYRMVSVLAIPEEIKRKYLNDSHISFIDVIAEKPREELGITGFDLSANSINLVHRFYPDISGAGEHISLKEQAFDTTDIDLKGRIDPSPLAAPQTTNHANMMATIIAGGGNSVWYALGVAPASRVSSSDFANLMPDESNVYLDQNITVQNHSYGTIIDNEYSLTAAAFDQNTNQNPGLLHVFSSGNSGMDTSSSGPYAGVAGFANLTGDFKMAKNVMLVGGVDSFGNVVPQSSRGPTYDGRIKPDIVAFQMNGTSESAALVSGTAGLLQQSYKLRHSDSLLPSALARAVLINSATVAGNPGPDYSTGFGNLNAFKAMNTLQANNIFSGIAKENEEHAFTINIPARITKLKVTLCWNDPAATAGAPVALINDLDLVVTNPSGITYLPWCLSSAPESDSLKKNATRKRDSLNNVEQVTIENPPPGSYVIRVNGFSLLTDSQRYYIAYEIDSANSFQWQKPLRTDLVQAASKNTIRWQSNISGGGIFEYSLAPYSKWDTISALADLSKRYFAWNVPDTTGRAVLRLKAGLQIFYSDTILISTLANPKVGFICGDTMLIYWNKIKNAQEYNLYDLGTNYLKAFKTVTGTSVLLSKEEVSSKFLSVAPIIGKDTGTKSYAFNYELQATGCYINSFIVNNNSGNAFITLNLGTLYLVDSISFEIKTALEFQTIYSASNNGGLAYEYTYKLLHEGVSYFRTRITLSNGKTIYSEVQSLLFLHPGDYLVAPNPVRRDELLHIYSGEATNATLIIVDASGRRILSKQISSVYEFIDISKLSVGIYLYEIRKEGIRKFAGKFIVVN